MAALADFAAGGAVLEFGVGTGRLAVPLAERDVEVTGVDISPEMLEKQVELFRNAARHLRPGGRFVLKTEVVTSPSADQGKLSVVYVGADQVMLSGGTTDPVTGVYTGTLMVVGTDGTRFYPEGGRSCTHFEMDLMAQLAGLEREDRWGDWKGTPFGPRSELHVSIYREP